MSGATPHAKATDKSDIADQLLAILCNNNHNERERKMERLEFLQKARQIACEQVDASSCLTEREFAKYQKMDEEKGLYKKAKEILEEAALDIEE